MPLANFFEKNAIAAHHILGGLDPEALRRLLAREVVGVAVDEEGACSLEGRRTAELTVDLLARFYPRLRLLDLGGGVAANNLLTKLSDRARSINPCIELIDDPVTRIIVVGSTAADSGAETVLYVGSAGWTLKFSPSEPVGSGTGANPFGAGAAACFGVANLFRSVMGEYLPGSRLDNSVEVSVVDWGSPYCAEPPDLDQTTVQLSETLLAGVGAIGNAVVWSLARVPLLEGSIRLVDPETVNLTNLQRYVLTQQASVGVPKVDLGAGEITCAHPNLDVTAHPVRWGAYLHERDNWVIPRIATAFDTAEDRINAQGALPKTLLNGWTQLGDLGVSRHTKFGQIPCAACLYSPRVGGKSRAELVANDLGFEGAPPEIRHMLYTGEPVTDLFVRQVAEKLGKTQPSELEQLLRLVGMPLHDFHNTAVCGGVLLELGVRPGDDTVEAPMAFQSALAGILLAAEIILDAHREQIKEDLIPPVRTVLDILRPLPKYPHPAFSRRERCICSDQEYLTAYCRKYGLQAKLGVG